MVMSSSTRVWGTVEVSPGNLSRKIVDGKEVVGKEIDMVESGLLEKTRGWEGGG
jgi:hypothetical protein